MFDCVHAVFIICGSPKDVANLTEGRFLDPEIVILLIDLYKSVPHSLASFLVLCECTLPGFISLLCFRSGRT